MAKAYENKNISRKKKPTDAKINEVAGTKRVRMGLRIPQHIYTQLEESAENRGLSKTAVIITALTELFKTELFRSEKEKE